MQQHSYTRERQNYDAKSPCRLHNEEWDYSYSHDEALGKSVVVCPKPGI